MEIHLIRVDNKQDCEGKHNTLSGPFFASGAVAEKEPRLPTAANRALYVGAAHRTV